MSWKAPISASVRVSSRPCSSAPLAAPRWTASTRPGVLGTHLVVEHPHLLDPGLVGALREEAVEPGRGAVGRGRPQRPDREIRAPRVHVELHRREEDVVLRRGHRVAHVIGSRVRVRVGMHRRELAEAQPDRLHPLPLLVDQLHEARVVQLAVVALEVVLDRDLPICLDLVGAAVVEAQRVHVEAVLRDNLGKVAQRDVKSRRVHIRVREHERAPRVHLRGHQAEAGHVEVGLVLAARRAAQAAVEAVGPGVVGALDRAALLRLVHEDGAAVAAHVQEGAKLLVAVEHHDQRQAAHLRGEHAAGAVQLAQVPHVLPRAPKDRVALQARHLGVDVPAVRQCLYARLDLRVSHRRIILPESIPAPPPSGWTLPTSRAPRSRVTWRSRRA